MNVSGFIIYFKSILYKNFDPILNPKLSKVGLEFFNASKDYIVSPKKYFVKNGMSKRTFFIYSIWVWFWTHIPPNDICITP